MGRRSHKGFTLIETIAALAIMITLVAIAVPMAIKFMETQETKSARTEMSHIFNDIFFGDPKNGTYGFVGDLGIYPEPNQGSNNLPEELIKNVHNRPAYHTSKDAFGNPTGVKFGWNGPYSPDGENLLKDPWGEYYLFKYDPYNAAIIISKGPNRRYEGASGDDLIYPIHGEEIHVYGSVLIEVRDERSNHHPPTETLLFYYSDKGKDAYKKAECSCSPPGYICSVLFDGTYVHHGLHFIELLDNKGNILSSTVATVIHGQQTKVTLTLR